MSNTRVLEGPDGMLYEIPTDVLAKYAVPGPKVAELRARLAAKAAPAESALPPGHHRMPPAAASAAAPAVINIYVGGGAPPTVQVHQGGQAAGSGVEGYHLAVDEHGIPHHHNEMLWGDYIDKQGKPAVGYHSHDPVTGNAQ